MLPFYQYCKRSSSSCVQPGDSRRVIAGVCLPHATVFECQSALSGAEERQLWMLRCKRSARPLLVGDRRSVTARVWSVAGGNSCLLLLVVNEGVPKYLEAFHSRGILSRWSEQLVCCAVCCGCSSHVRVLQLWSTHFSYRTLHSVMFLVEVSR